MAAEKASRVFRGLAVAGGGESSESEDDGWEIGYLDRASQKLKGPLPTEDKNETFKKALTTGDISLVQELLSSAPPLKNLSFSHAGRGKQKQPTTFGAPNRD